jgi:pimeloyl-[acyl-carrier protein] methyl ester esterase
MSKIHKEVYGQGKSIVLIHGWAMHTGIWRVFAQQLAQNYQVICLDVPGHGFSETVEPYTLDAIAEVLIEAIPESSFCLLGWSLGASIAITMAKKYPQRIDSLICLAGNPRFVESEGWHGMDTELLEQFATNLQLSFQSTLLRFLALQVYGLSNSKGLLKQLKLAIYECEPPSKKVLKQALNLLKQADLRADLSQINCPLRIIQGDKDTLIPVQVGSDMQKLRLNSQLNIIPGAGHVPFLSHPLTLINTMSNFV